MTRAERMGRLAPAARRRIARATMLWSGVALTGTVVLALLTIWHLVRRGRVIRASSPAPRAIAPLDARPADPL